MSIIERIKWILLPKPRPGSTGGARDVTEPASSQEMPDSFSRWFDKVREEKRLARQLHDQQLRDDSRDEEAQRQRTRDFKLRCPTCGSIDVELAYEGRFKCGKCGKIFT